MSRKKKTPVEIVHAGEHAAYFFAVKRQTGRGCWWGEIIEVSHDRRFAKFKGSRVAGRPRWVETSALVDTRSRKS
jgi:hypothetical protein